ncbi:MAG TPA: EAL domain-containing protein [Telluria sp.]
MSKERSELSNDAWYRVLFKLNPIPMLMYDPGTLRFIDANGSAIDLYGYSLKEWTLLALPDLHSLPNLPDDHEPPGAHPYSAIFLPGTWHHLRKDGTVIDVNLIRYSIADERRSAQLLIVYDVTSQCQLEASLRSAKQDLDRAQNIARLGSWTRDFLTETDRWSDQTYRNFGLAPQVLPASFSAFLNIVHPGDRDRVDAAVRLAVATRQPFAFRHRVVWQDGSVHVLQEQGIVVHDHSTQPQLLIGTTLDITEQASIELQLRETEKEFQSAQRIAHLGTWVLNAITGKFDSWSEETFRVFGYPAPELHSYDFVLTDRIHREDRERLKQARDRALVDPRVPYDTEFRVLNPKLGERIVHAVAETVVDQEGSALRMVGFVQDVTEARQAEEQTRNFAYYDKATHLPNRTSLEQFLSDLFAPPNGVNGQVGVLTIHLTRFREINFTLSHGEGDQLLRAVGARIIETLEGNGFVSCVSNSQFAVAIKGADGGRATETAQKIFAALQTPFLIAGINYGLGAHVGIALAPTHGNDAATILRKSDVALFQAKQSGRACVIYDPARDPYNPQRLALIGEFRKSLLAGELRLYCQPKVDIRSGNIVGAEALVRWEHPSYGLISPDQFVPLIEKTELIHALTQFMLEASIQQCIAWRREGVFLPIAINLSPRNLVEPTLVHNLQHTLSSFGAEPEWLGLEITESSLFVDPQLTIKELNSLSKLGFCLYIDDFGTGYSSLSYLLSLPVNVIKIDHSFTMRMIEDKKAATIVRSTIDLAHNLGLQVVAEGAANKEIWDSLKLLGCDEAQGYYISRALPAQEFLPWMQRSGFGVARTLRSGQSIH